ncbi:MAG: hypothetical protein QXW32_04175 [Nitrososphaerales archaeon]
MINIPKWIEDVFQTYLTSEFTYMDGDNPKTVAVVSFYDAARSLIILTTSPAFYYKVKCIKRNPKVSLLYSNSNYSGLEKHSVVLVQGEANIDEENPHRNNQYIMNLMSKQKESWKKTVVNKMIKELTSPIGKLMMDWYTIRILIEIKPHIIYAWQDGNLEKPPEALELKQN